MGVDFNAGSLPQDAQIKAFIKSGLKGHLAAWDPIARKKVWRVELGRPCNGGVLSTAGGLVFQGNGMGNFVAYRADTGERLWSAETQAGVLAAPISYLGGRRTVCGDRGGLGRSLRSGRRRTGGRFACRVESAACAGLQAGRKRDTAGVAYRDSCRVGSAAGYGKRVHRDGG